MQMDTRVRILTFSTTTKTSRTTVRHKLIRRSSLRPVCVALVEEASRGLLECFQATSSIVVTTYRANILTHRVNLVQHTTRQGVVFMILRVSTPLSCVAHVGAVKMFRTSTP